MISSETRPSEKRALSAYLISLLLFGSNGIVASRISLSSSEVVLMRTLIGSVVLLAVFLLSGRRFTFMLHKRQLLAIAVSGVSMGASWMFLFEAYTKVGVSIASLLYYCGPVIVMALSPLLFGEKLTKWRVTGFAAVLAGAFLVNGQAAAGGLSAWGLLCGALSAVTYAVMVIANKRAVDIPGLENTTIQLVTAFFTVAAFSAFRGGLFFEIPTADLIWVLIIGVVNTGAGCLLYFSSIGHLPVQTVAVCGYLEPLCAVVLSVLILGEVMLPLRIVGAVLIIGGAAFAELAGRR